MSRDLDRIDHAILAVLRNNARLTNKELAARVGLAPSSCLERVRRLHEERVLRGYYAEIRPDALGIGLQAMIAVRLSRHSRTTVESFREHLKSMPELMDIYHLAGANDFLLRVGVRDSDHLRELILSAFTSRPEVAHVETALIFEHVRPTGTAPIVSRGPANPGS